jgi:hypothetical protein
MNVRRSINESHFNDWKSSHRTPIPELSVVNDRLLLADLRPSSSAVATSSVGLLPARGVIAASGAD